MKTEFAAFRDLGLKWTGPCRWIGFEVSDYLRNTPWNVIWSMAEGIRAGIEGQDIKLEE